MGNPECKTSAKSAMGKKHRFLVLSALVIGVLLGYLVHGLFAAAVPPATGHLAADAPESAAEYTCSMHPQIRQPGPGLCPICGMELIPLHAGDSGDAGPRALVTSEAAKALMDLETARVERRFVDAEIRMTGKVAFDETRLANISAWVPGRIDRLFVDYTGIQVRKGDHMVSLYSPELLIAQQELRTAAEALARINPAAPPVLRNTAEAAVTGAREKLRRWGLTDDQIRAAESKDGLSDHVTIYAPIGGTVIERNGTDGMYVMTGEMIYRIADLSRVWVLLDAYESDLAWLRYGQTVSFTTEAYPGRTFTGRVSFIDPQVGEQTRTVKLRVNVPNGDAMLKPNMFVHAVVHSQLATGGRVCDPDLAGKWISPMHPEIVKDGPGTCDICGMPLVRAEELGYVPESATEADAPLVVPASAPLITGKRAVVYVELPGTEKPTFEGREVVLGPRAGDFYLVESGLEEGDIVVTNGNFKIDSALQILAKPSMMNPEPEPAPPPTPESAPPVSTHAPEAFRVQLRGVVDAYLIIQQALAKDDAAAAAQACGAASDALGKVDMTLISGDAHMAWMARLKEIEAGLEAFKAAGTDIEKQRTAFLVLSTVLIQSADQFGLAGAPVQVVHCPMAFDNRGADWLQSGTDVRNPYFGASMPTCGAVKRSIGTETHAEDHAHE